MENHWTALLDLIAFYTGWMYVIAETYVYVSRRHWIAAAAQEEGHNVRPITADMRSTRFMSLAMICSVLWWLAIWPDVGVSVPGGPVSFVIFASVMRAVLFSIAVYRMHAHWLIMRERWGAAKTVARIACWTPVAAALSVWSYFGTGLGDLLGI